MPSKNSNRSFDSCTKAGKCSTCAGSGTLWSGNFMGKKPQPMRCPTCKGSGRS